MEQAEKYLYEKYTKYNDWRYYPPSESTMVKIMEDFAEQIRSEEQAKTRKVAIEFAVDMISPFTTDYKEILTKLYNDRFDEWFTNKAQHCSECGKPMEKKEIIIKGDIDTCDECLCPE